MAKSKPVSPAAVHARESRRLSTLLEVSQALLGHAQPAVGAAPRARDPRRSTTAPSAASSRCCTTTASCTSRRRDGLDAPSHAVRYRLGEGIIGKVVESSKPIVVPRVSREPAFLNRAAKRPELHKEELSFICVPILLNRRAVGALGVDLKFNPDRDYDRQRQVPRHRRVDHRRRPSRSSGWSRTTRSGWSTRTRSCGRS